MPGFFSRRRQPQKSIAVQPARQNLRWSQSIFFFKAGPRLKRLNSDRVFAVARNWPQANPFKNPLNGRFAMHLAKSTRGYSLTRCLRRRPYQSKHHRDRHSTIFALLLESRCQGIGEWTAQTIAERGLGDADAFPASDLGIVKALSDAGQPLKPAHIRKMAERWRPWLSYAAMLLWMMRQS